jgi:ATP-dependent Lhr-like helicase
VSASLEEFSAPVREWFTASFADPTPAQAAAWPAIARGEHTLLCAPTGSGKTLAAFLWALDRLGGSQALARESAQDSAEGSSAESSTESSEASTQSSGSAAGSPRTRVLYISPLRALAVDIEKNLRSPLRGIALAAERAGRPWVAPSVGVRTGDTSASERRSLVRHPPEILITTPESLFLMLTSAARETLTDVETVIVDEIHALAPTKRGAHMALSLERLERLVSAARREGGHPVTAGAAVQRIGLSATQRPLETVAGFLAGAEVLADSVTPRPVTIVDAGMSKELDLRVVVPVPDMSQPGVGESGSISAPDPEATTPSIWTSVHPLLLELVESHNSTLVFVNARRMAERLSSRLNELAHEEAPDHTAGEATGTSPGDESLELVKAHHGSLSRERRLQVEDELKSGSLRGLVATSSLELGIDMGAVDLVVQVSSPGSVASGLQRIGRAGHQVGAPSRGRIFPKHRADLLEAAVVTRRMHEGLIERTSVPRNPLDVLAQQVVAIVALDDWPDDELFDLVRGAANYRDLTRPVFDSVLDLLSGRYPSEEFSELRPRIVWDRIAGTVRGRSSAQRLAVTNAGTIPDRGLFGVFLPDGTRVGELDEEMVYESRVGETFLLGATTWQIQEITFERVVVTPAPGRPGKMPFWHGDGPGRDAELGAAIGEFVRKIRAMPRDEAFSELLEHHDLDDLAADNLVAYLDEQADATGVVPDDRTLVVERFRDEIGDWRVCIHSPHGSRVHAPWAMALRARLEEHFGGTGDGEHGPFGGATGVEVLWSDDGIVVRLPEAAEELPTDILFGDPDEIEAEVVAALPASSTFAARFRECAARSLLLPRRRPDQRTPLWQQRQRSADLLSVASKYPSFPVLLETTREMCNDVYDLPALKRLLADVRSRRTRVVTAETQLPSPFARSLLFGWIAVYMYEGDAPLAERRAAALALDRDLLRELLGAEELRSLLDADVVATVELELQRLVEGRGARDADEVHDLLRVLGPMSRLELSARTEDPSRLDELLQGLLSARRVFEAGIAQESRLAASEDAGRLRDALGVALPQGLPAAFTESTEHPVRELVARHARTHGPFTAASVARRFGLSREVVDGALAALVSDGRVVEGEFTPGGVETEHCDAEVLRRLRRRSLASLRKEVEPVGAAALARFVPRWQGVGSTHRGTDAVAEAVGILQGASLVASTLEADLLATRVAGYRPADLDLLCSTGEVVWCGAGGLGAHDGRVRIGFRDQFAALVDPPSGDLPGDPHHEVIRRHLAASGASFWAELNEAVRSERLPGDDESLLEALWDLVWSGEVTNDTLAPLRSRLAGGLKRRGSGARSRRRPDLRAVSRTGPPAAAGRWSLTAPLFAGAPSPTESATARALQLLHRYGVLTREMALAEGTQGGFAGVYPLLKVLEERGQVRRGYFVEGLGAAQFALPGAVDRLRAEGAGPPDAPTDPGGASERLPWEPEPEPGGQPDAWVLAATDPAQPFGASLAWPESTGQPSRSAGGYVVLCGGEAAAYVERGGRSLLTFPAASDCPGWADALAGLVRSQRVRRLRIEQIDGARVAASPHARALKDVGFADGYKGLTLG